MQIRLSYYRNTRVSLNSAVSNKYCSNQFCCVLRITINCLQIKFRFFRKFYTFSFKIEKIIPHYLRTPKSLCLLDLGSGGFRCLALSTSTLICSLRSCTRILTLPKGNSCIFFCSRCLSQRYLAIRTLLSEAQSCNWASILSKVSSLGDLSAQKKLIKTLRISSNV